MSKSLRQELNQRAIKASRKFQLAQQIYIDFRKWRIGRVVAYGPTARTFKTARCSRCRRIGLRVESVAARVRLRTGTKFTHLSWHIHIATVDALGDRLLPYKFCTRSKGEPPVIFIKSLLVET